MGASLPPGWFQILSASTWIHHLSYFIPDFIFRAIDPPRYCAIKILTAHATRGIRDGYLLELEMMKTIAKLTNSFRLPYLLDHFETEGPYGQHLCLVQRVLSSDVGSFRLSAPHKRLGFPIVKIIVAQVVEALVTLHAARIIHTGQ